MEIYDCDWWYDNCVCMYMYVRVFFLLFCRCFVCKDCFDPNSSIHNNNIIHIDHYRVFYLSFFINTCVHGKKLIQEYNVVVVELW